MKLNKYIIIGVGALCMALTSCNDFLDQVPDERTDINSEEKIDRLLVSAYPSFNPSWLLEIMSDNLIDNQAPHLPSNPNLKAELSHSNYSHYDKWDNEMFRFEPAKSATYGDYDSPGSAWGQYYGCIATANQAINAINNLTDNADPSTFSASLQASWGEAHLLRAYCHFMLVNIFSNAYKNEEKSKQDVGIPYVTDCEDVVRKDYDRSNVYDTYMKIGQDLEEGLKYISDVNFKTAPKYHFNVNAAHAFASRYYLYIRNWDKVIEHADFVLGTEEATTKKMLMDYSIFSECTSMSDYGLQWQSPDLNNNLMLLCTNSLFARRCFGSRYSCNSSAACDALMIHSSPLWGGYIYPAMAIVSYSILSSSTGDYGYYTCKIEEQFEYKNKLAGTGYPHIIYRAFTGNFLLLERAEAKIMKGTYADAGEDLKLYWNSAIDSFSEDDKKSFVNTNYIKYMTDDIFLDDDEKSKDPVLKGYYSAARAKKAEEARDKKTDGSSIGNAAEGEETTTVPKDETYNRFSDWSFTQLTSPDYIIPEAAIPYMNCLNDFRRFETLFEGQRYLDIKRWSMKLVHTVGIDSEEYVNLPESNTRAIEVPWETMEAGMATSRPAETSAPQTRSVSLNLVKTNTK